MLFTEAFAKLGYLVESPRQDWSAAGDNGVCLSLWREEMVIECGRLWMDTRIHAGPHAMWVDKRGNILRMKHIQEALAAHDGFVDVVIVKGKPGMSYGDAEPWVAAERRGHRWRVTDFDGSTGHFRAEVTAPKSGVAGDRG